MLGYLNAPSPFDEDGFMNTGDQVEQDGEWIRILGRESEIINIGGEKVYPAEIESVVLQLDGVEDVAVYGKSHPIKLKHTVCTSRSEEQTVMQHCLHFRSGSADSVLGADVLQSCYAQFNLQDARARARAPSAEPLTVIKANTSTANGTHLVPPRSPVSRTSPL